MIIPSAFIFRGMSIKAGLKHVLHVSPQSANSPGAPKRFILTELDWMMTAILSQKAEMPSALASFGRERLILLPSEEER